MEMETEKVVAEAEELPRAIVRRVLKDKLAKCSPDYDVSVHKEALLAFAESARIFIHYLSATANDICKESKRQTINANDVFKALEEIDFPEFSEPLRVSLEDFKRTNSGKKGGGGSNTKATKKRKAEESSQKDQTKRKPIEVENNKSDNEEDEEDKEDDEEEKDES